MADIYDLSPEDFEWFSKFFLENTGYENVQVTQKHGELQGDGGVDLHCQYQGKNVHVQCKKWRYGFKGHMKIGPVRELGGCMLRDNIPLGVFIGTLGYDAYTKRDAERMRIRLIDGQEIAKLMQTWNPKFNPSKKRSFLQRMWKNFVFVVRAVLGLERKFKKS